MKLKVSPDFMLIDLKDSLEKLGSENLWVVDQLRDLPKHNPEAGERVAFVPKQISNRDMLEVIKQGLAESVIQPFRPDVLLRDIKSWVHLRSDEGRYFIDPIAILLPELIQRKDIQFLPNSEQKEFIRMEVESFLHPFGNKSAHASIAAVFEELYMNAVIDAPREAGEMPSQQVVDEKHKIDVLLGVDSHSILIGFRDYFGSLVPERLIGKLIKVADMGKFSSMNFGPFGGAGIGTTILMENSSHVFFGRQKNQISLVCCLIPRNLNNRDRQSYPRTLHFIFK
jgi:hypothetical protein